jgi:hypothetical protein
MELTYTAHAVERMQQRKITPALVEAIVTSPDGRISQSHDKEICHKALSGRDDNEIAVVVLRFKGARTEVLTVMNFFRRSKP